MQVLLFLLSVCLCMGSFSCAGENTSEVTVKGSGKIHVEGREGDYKIFAGTLPVKDDKEQLLGQVFYTAYFLQDIDETKRPIAFCFNGGPGAGSVWLNLGLLGPKCIPGDDISFSLPPYATIDNPDTFLDKWDLVFVDPIPSGLSTLAGDENSSKVYGVDEDVKVLSQFIRHFISKFQRWDSPKFFVGESYGGLRVVKLAHELYNDWGVYLNGLVLISPALDLRTIQFDAGNDLPFALYLPTYALVNSYHKKEKGDTRVIQEQAESFAINEYLAALAAGSSLEEGSRKLTADKLAHFTGLNAEQIASSGLRIRPENFHEERFAKEDFVVGRFDGRIRGSLEGSLEHAAFYDPSLEAVYGFMTAAYTQFILKDLQWPQAKVYRPLASMPQWNWGKGNQYANCLKELAELLERRPSLKVFVAAGQYDLAVPYFATTFSLNHIFPWRSMPSQKTLSLMTYPAGHMMFLNRSIRSKMKKDINNFFN